MPARCAFTSAAGCTLSRRSSTSPFLTWSPSFTTISVILPIPSPEHVRVRERLDFARSRDDRGQILAYRRGSLNGDDALIDLPDGEPCTAGQNSGDTRTNSRFFATVSWVCSSGPLVRATSSNRHLSNCYAEKPSRISRRHTKRGKSTGVLRMQARFEVFAREAGILLARVGTQTEPRSTLNFTVISRRKKVICL